MLKPAIFLDRDGTINIDKHYLYKPADWEWLEGSIEAIRTFNNAGYRVIVATNQSGIARGFFTMAEVHGLHQQVDQWLAPHGARIDAYYICPHHPDFGTHRACECRKPKPGLLLQAAREHAIDLSHSWMIGDKTSDVNAGLAAGCRSIMLTSSSPQTEHTHTTPCVENLAAAARIIFSVS